jgi:tetratricopeptide (TPR) repeat protein
MTRMLGACLALLVAGTAAWAIDEGPVTPPPAAPAAVPSPEARYNAGLALANQGDWRGAEAAYRDALRVKPAFPEAWNGLGYALRRQGRYAESLRAYQEALRLRPDYPQALEYLGQAYVQLGMLEEARAIVARLRLLDAREAEELAEAIGRASAGR